MNFSKIVVKYRHGLVGTLLVHAVLFVFLSNTHIKDYERFVEEEEILAEFDFTNQVPEHNINDNQEYSSENLTNATSNLNQEKSTYTNSFNKSSMDENIENELKDLEKQFFDELKEGRDEVKEIKADKTDNSALIDKNAEQNDKAQLGADVFTTASFSLKDRYDLSLPVPSYICQQEGVVVVSIRVNQKGEVKSASLHYKGTTTSNECLIENALKYAKRARFNQNFSADNPQSGTLKYVFTRQ